MNRLCRHRRLPPFDDNDAVVSPLASQHVSVHSSPVPMHTKVKQGFGQALFACLFGRTFSAKEHCFSLTTNHTIVLFSLSFQQSEWIQPLFK
jgi:hypothetical protein